ncbi:AraC family transcriptional regulator [Roseibacillus persicicus]|nr:AraC family transcriptional regulator [Roseibacillus persicicus]MDQ8191606.1 AraC family transcriptional regulator [Roseibacillus persicicus]
MSHPHWGDELFDEVADTVYFVKDLSGRYVAVNETLVRRCGAASKKDLIGKTAAEVFPAPLGEDYTRQDLALIQGEPDITNRLELHLYPGGESGWCLTWKKALRGQSGDVIGLSGISRDVNSTPDDVESLEGLSKVLSHIRDHLDEPLTLGDLERATRLSAFQIKQRIKRLFGISPRQYIMRSRIESARHQLTYTNLPLSEIALACGFGDQSSFTRQFKRSVGITPKAYRDQ